MQLTKTQRETRNSLWAAGFQTRNLVKANGYAWFEVIKGEECGLVVRQNAHAYHWFAQNIAATGSGTSVSCCDRGGLGEAIGTDAEIRTYKKLIRQSPMRLQQSYAGLYEAVCQVLADDASH